MVPYYDRSDLAEDPLQVFAEPYNTLILDKKGFRGEIPEIQEFCAQGEHEGLGGPKGLYS